MLLVSRILASHKETHMTKTTETTKTLKPGDKVTFNGGFPGTVVRFYSAGMIEVRGERGLVCIPVEDAKPA
jgi:preprotein translocase subunit YajC